MNNSINILLSALKNGEIVSFPTETVYALACDAYNKKAVEKIFAFKGRNFNNPLAILASDIQMLETIALFDNRARKLAQKFCPGPITFILPLKKNSLLPSIVNAGKANIAVRIPDNKIALEIIKKYNSPLIGTSANPSGEPSATSYDDVKKYFGKNLSNIIDGGKCDIGIASTIVDLSNDEITIVRDGIISKDDIINQLDK